MNHLYSSCPCAYKISNSFSFKDSKLKKPVWMKMVSLTQPRDRREQWVFPNKFSKKVEIEKPVGFLLPWTGCWRKDGALGAPRVWVVECTPAGSLMAPRSACENECERANMYSVSFGCGHPYMSIILWRRSWIWWTAMDWGGLGVEAQSQATHSFGHDQLQYASASWPCVATNGRLWIIWWQHGCLQQH